MRLAAPIPRMSAWVRIEFSQNVLKIAGARIATTSPDDADEALGRDLRALEAHATLPNSPCGRNASTSAMSANVRTTEYCWQQSLPVIGRYATANEKTSP